MIQQNFKELWIKMFILVNINKLMLFKVLFEVCFKRVTNNILSIIRKLSILPAIRDYDLLRIILFFFSLHEGLEKKKRINY